MMTSRRIQHLLTILIGITPLPVSAADPILSQLPINEAPAIVDRYVTGLRTISNPPFKMELDAAHAIVLQSKDRAAEILFIPNTSMKLDPEDALLAQDRGAAVGWLILHGLEPTNKTKKEGCKPLTFDGKEYQGTTGCQLTVRRLTSGELRLELWGVGDGPVAAAELLPSAKPVGEHVTLQYVSGLLAGSGLAKSLFFLPLSPVISAPMP